MKTDYPIHYSVVIPFFNEAPHLQPLIDEVEEVMKKLGAPWELLAINDGSTDDTEEILNELTKEKLFLRPVHFEANYGQSSAFDAGFRLAKGTFIITLDGDGQNNPHDIPLLLEQMGEVDMICGRRRKRKDTLVKRILSKIANGVRKRVCRDGIHDTGCSLKISRSEAIKKIYLYNGMHRFLPALLVNEGFRVKEIWVDHRPRLAGTSKYHFFNRSFNTIFDLFAVYWMRKRRLRYRIRQEKSSDA